MLRLKILALESFVLKCFSLQCNKFKVSYEMCFSQYIYVPLVQIGKSSFRRFHNILINLVKYVLIQGIYLLALINIVIMFVSVK